MYTNINNKDGLTAVYKTFLANPDPNRPDYEILQLLKLRLENNDFEFNGKYYLQKTGVAMGKRFAPSYANIFMANWEKEVLDKCNKKPFYYGRFLDDIKILWTHSRTDFDVFFETLNNHNPCIKLKATISEDSIDLLDTTIFKGSGFRETGILDIKVFFKPTDTHELLHKSSFHPKHTFPGIVKSQILRFHRICTQKADFEKAVRILFTVLGQRGYSQRFLRKIKTDTLFHIQNKKATQEPATPEVNKDLYPLIPFVIPYSNTGHIISRSIKKEFKNLQGLFPEVYDKRLVIAFCRNKNLSNLLTKSQLK